MLAYVNMVQRAEATHNVETLTHQKWSGAELIDTMLATVTGGLASTAAMGQVNKHTHTERRHKKRGRQQHPAQCRFVCVVFQGNTEAQFKSVTKKKTEEQFSQLLD